MKTNYFFQVYKLDSHGMREKLIAEGYTEEFGDKITARSKAEQKSAIECKYGYGKSIYMKRVEGVSDAQKIATAKYDTTNTTGVYLKLNNKTDTDIIEHLQKQDNKQGYIKELIRQDIKNNL